MLPAFVLRLPVLALGLAGLVVIATRLRTGRRSAANWIASSCFLLWVTGTGFGILAPYLEEARVLGQLRYFVENMFSVAFICLVYLLVTTFGIRPHTRPFIVAATLAVAVVLWFTPGHG